MRSDFLLVVAAFESTTRVWGEGILGEEKVGIGLIKISILTIIVNSDAQLI